MKNAPTFLLYLGIALVLGFTSGCSEDETSPIDNPPVTESNVVTVDSYSDGKVSVPSGFEIEIPKGAVPEATANSPATVAFSVETGVEPPEPLPPAIGAVGQIVKFGPDGFIFRTPVRVKMPYNSDADPTELGLMFYDRALEKWIAIPTAEIDVQNQRICADVLELGFFTLVDFGTLAKLSGTTSMGGFEFDGMPGYYYTLTVKSVSFKYAFQQPWFPDIVGSTAGTGNQPAGGPGDLTHFILPQGGYEIWISRTTPGTLSTLPKLETYTVPAQGNINRPLKHTQMSVRDWTILNAPGGGQWVEGRPQAWPATTAPLGTGQLQATLTWGNSESSAADVDLHLYGPNDMHVYWSDEQSDDGSIELDQDWQEELGHAAENIYSVKAMPKGHYSIAVHHFYGATKPYNLRVILNGKVKTFTGTAKDGKLVTHMEFDI
ncbi:MAG: hypothetical protein CL946_03790 [Ectothiorhodospiraceae bacterium]|nr:hypothetical protein [Ectothiorhodospiraceae bacterium]